MSGSVEGRRVGRKVIREGVTGTAGLAEWCHWRARRCVVLTGLGTILADDPQLNVRWVPTPRQLVRAVVDSRFDIPEQARIIDGGPIWLFTARPDAAKADRLRERNVTVVDLPPSGQDAGHPQGRPEHIDLARMLGWMAQHEVNERSEEHTSELQSLMRTSYAVFCLK